MNAPWSASAPTAASLFRIEAPDYGPAHAEHLFKLYELFVESADRTSVRRQTANAFFLSLTTAVVAPASIVEGLGQVTLAIAGLALTLVWSLNIRTYRDLNRAKFAVIHEIEQRLPAAPFGSEWARLREGERPAHYRTLHHAERLVPWVFAALYAVLLLVGLDRLAA